MQTLYSTLFIFILLFFQLETSLENNNNYYLCFIFEKDQYDQYKHVSEAIMDKYIDIEPYYIKYDKSDENSIRESIFSPCSIKIAIMEEFRDIEETIFQINDILKSNNQFFINTISDALPNCVSNIIHGNSACLSLYECIYIIYFRYELS